MEKIKIPFNKPAFTGNELSNIKEAVQNRRFSGDNMFSRKCCSWFKDNFKSTGTLLCPSGTHALELSALLCNIMPGDEVIMPSFTFSSTANAFVLRGAKIVFVDIRPDTMNIDENLIEDAITEKTRAIVPVHYAGVSCEMDTIMKIAEKHNLFVVEDAAQAIMSKYRGNYLGTIGHFGCLSFHETKNIQCGEGGALFVSDDKFMERAEIIREKGTNRTMFWRGEIDRYTWVDIGSSYLMSELNAAFLYAQLEMAEEITQDRLKAWKLYHEGLKPLAEKGFIELPTVPDKCGYNGHIFYIKVIDGKKRKGLIDFLREREIWGIFHYIPLHTSDAGKRYGRFCGEDVYTTKESERLLRLPLYFNIDLNSINHTINAIINFFQN